jgi:pyruvate-formate lyase
MTIQDQYIDSFRQTQETWAGVVEYFTKDLQRTFEQPYNPFAVVDPNETIDQIFDFWGKSLEVQRDVVKQLVSTTIAATEKVREQVESASAAVREQAESAGAAVREQAESVNEALRKQASATSAAFREQTTKSYDALTKAELQDELAKRDLPKTGNVDELRERLVADDLN